MWIRDGVLVDRMHVNPVAFAVAYMAGSGTHCRRPGLLEDLINFGFEKSGISCAEKMHLYNLERDNLLSNVEQAVSLYNDLAAIAAEQCDYFEGAVELLRHLSECGVKNYITSAVEQENLDKWSHSPQGAKIAPYLTEILGRRQNFIKGQDHFKYVSDRSDGTYYVADAVSEIATGKKFSSQFNVRPIGFAHAITRQRVGEAVDSVYAALRSVDLASDLANALPAHLDKLQLPAGEEIARALTEAGAEFTVTDPQLYTNLRAYFHDCLP